MRSSHRILEDRGLKKFGRVDDGITNLCYGVKPTCVCVCVCVYGAVLPKLVTQGPLDSGGHPPSSRASPSSL
jgi:hypothetical protein